jgi:hypothetical protein
LFTTQYFKSEVISVWAMKAYRGRRDIAPLILNLGARWRGVFIFHSHYLALFLHTTMTVLKELTKQLEIRKDFLVLKQSTMKT